MAEPAHEQVMEKMIDTAPVMPAAPAVKDPKFRIRRGVVFGTALVVIGIGFAVGNAFMPAKGVNSLFLLTLFALAGGGWLLFDAFLESRARSEQDRSNVTSIKEKLGRH